MKPASQQTPETLDDIIFEDRNKTYGAYYLRSTYDATVKKAISISISVSVLAILLISHFAFRDIKVPVTFVDSGPVLTAEQVEIRRENDPQPKSIETPKVKTNPVSETFKPVEKPVEQPKPEEHKPEEKPNDNPLGSPNGNETKTPINNETQGNNSNTTTETPDENPNTIHPYADENPEFAGGEAALRNYIITHFNVPNDVEDNIKMRLFFVVDENGDVSGIKIVKGAGISLDKEATRVVSGFPKWKPGKINGKTVKVLVSLPISIVLH